jgi:hypothetical protein
MQRSILISSFIFILIASFPLLAFADRPDKELYEAQKRQREYEHEHMKKKQELQKEQQKAWKEMEREDRKHYDQMKREYRNQRDYHRYSGYRERPYDRSRHYDYYNHKGRRYDYHGHWRSWDQWRKYMKGYPHIYKYGRYYHEGSHLMFRVCDPGIGSCIFFSIGR